MKKNSVIIKTVLSMIVVSFLIQLSSCDKKQIRLSYYERPSYLITYSKNEIVIKSSKKKEAEHFNFKNGEYFNSKDSTLFFSVIKDTIVSIRNKEITFKMEIEKENNGLFKTTRFLLHNPGPKFSYSIYYYDSKYQISKIIENDLIICK